ncbi:unnamed protein product [Anisakis simplex]|uniref:28S ribosomal protein S24, mitochondrial (inferred by orthology to a C. elegans protein) n=1 Tax=Anisakis simplex TaxID=6269 RepID=A0A0M3JKS5_ANISI|nr:unnamed protein product [Anisakis simplex]
MLRTAWKSPIFVKELDGILLSPASSTQILSNLSQKSISSTAVLHKSRADSFYPNIKRDIIVFKATIDRSQMLTYEMAQRPHHIGVKKAWLTWHSQNLEEFRQTQPYQVLTLVTTENEFLPFLI